MSTTQSKPSTADNSNRAALEPVAFPAPHPPGNSCWPDRPACSRLPRPRCVSCAAGRWRCDPARHKPGLQLLFWLPLRRLSSRSSSSRFDASRLHSRCRRFRSRSRSCTCPPSLAIAVRVVGPVAVLMLLLRQPLYKLILNIGMFTFEVAIALHRVPRRHWCSRVGRHPSRRRRHARNGDGWTVVASSSCRWRSRSSRVGSGAWSAIRSASRGGTTS